MKSLGIDYGSKRIGIAVSDEEGKIAFPHAVVENRGIKRLMHEINSLVRSRQPEAIVVGLPIGLDGKDTAQTQKARTFGERLGKTLRITVFFENEIFTTKIARESGVPAKRLDASSAALILQSFLDKQK